MVQHTASDNKEADFVDFLLLISRIEAQSPTGHWTHVAWSSVSSQHTSRVSSFDSVRWRLLPVATRPIGAAST